MSVMTDLTKTGKDLALEVSDFLRRQPTPAKRVDVPPPPTFKEIFSLAADVIEEHGWQRGDDGDIYSGFCGRGAIIHATKILTKGTCYYGADRGMSGNTLTDKAMSVANGYVQRRTNYSGVVQFNDATPLGKARMVKLLRELAATV